MGVHRRLPTPIGQLMELRPQAGPRSFVALRILRFELARAVADAPRVQERDRALWRGKDTGDAFALPSEGSKRQVRAAGCETSARQDRKFPFGQRVPEDLVVSIVTRQVQGACHPLSALP